MNRWSVFRGSVVNMWSVFSNTTFPSLDKVYCIVFWTLLDERAIEAMK